MDIVERLKNIEYDADWDVWNTAVKDAADEIERLQEANETIVVLNEQANNEVYWLEQEIERLREALERCADLSEKWEDSLVSQINLIARCALQQKDSE